jgi:arsenate reductase
MAEGLLNALYGNKFDAYSAGTSPTEINPYAIKAMAEVGIDISQHRSKSKEFHEKTFDYVVTVCDHAKATCPFFPGKTVLHHSFRDPSEFKGSKDKILKEIEGVRDEINSWIKETFKHL